MKNTIAPSILAADFGQLNDAVELVNNSEADYIHIDVMDGLFVPNISFGTPVIKAIQKKNTKTMDVHLMIEAPSRYISHFADLGADILTVHYEACTHLHRTLQSIHEAGMQTGVALNPHTPVAVLEDVLHEVDLVCIMSVNPGFGGQKFIRNTFKKVKQLKQMITNSSASTKIEIDGGVTDKNATELCKIGANVLVAGSFVFKSDQPEDTIKSLTKLAND